MPTIVLTGASRGLGVLIAESLAKPGVHLVLAARSEAGLKATAEKAHALGATTTLVPCDVTQAEDRERLLAAAGPVDILINNAGVENFVAVAEQTDEEIARQVHVNLLAPMYLTRAVLPAMMARDAGIVVMVSSMAGKSPTPYNAVYSATKFGLNGFTASLAIELRDSKVHVGTVCPGFVADAGMWADAGTKAPALFSEVSPARVVKAVHKVIAGRAEVLITPGPIRPLLAFAQIFPRLDGFMLNLIGVLGVMKTRAVAVAEQRRIERDASP